MPQYIPQDTCRRMCQGRWCHRPWRQLVEKRIWSDNDHWEDVATRTGQGDHIEVVTGHELDDELLPGSSLVWIPSNGTRGTLLENLSGTRRCRRDIRQSSQCKGKAHENPGKMHRGWMLLRWKATENGRKSKAEGGGGGT